MRRCRSQCFSLLARRCFVLLVSWWTHGLLEHASQSAVACLFLGHPWSNYQCSVAMARSWLRRHAGFAWLRDGLTALVVYFVMGFSLFGVFGAAAHHQATWQCSFCHSHRVLFVVKHRCCISTIGCVCSSTVLFLVRRFSGNKRGPPSNRACLGGLLSSPCHGRCWSS